MRPIKVPDTETLIRQYIRQGYTRKHAETVVKFGYIPSKPQHPSKPRTAKRVTRTKVSNAKPVAAATEPRKDKRGYTLTPARLAAMQKARDALAAKRAGAREVSQQTLEKMFTVNGLTGEITR